MNKTESEILVSIIIPVYNVENYIDNCINSLVNQTYKNIEIWLIDDGSTDNSSKICDEWEKRESRINVIHKKNGGVSSARNAGLKKCNGEYISFVDSDDYVAENFIEVLLNSSLDNNCEMAIINFIEVFPNGKEIKHHYNTRSKLLNRQEFLNNLHREDSYKTVLFNKIFLKSIIDKNTIMFEENIHYGEDFLFLVKYAEKSERFFYEFDQLLYYYYRRDESVTRNAFNEKTATLTKVSEEIISILEKNKAESSFTKKKYLFFYFFALYSLKDTTNYSKQKYKEICKKYFGDVLKSKEITISDKITLFGVVKFPKTMSILRKIKIFLRRK